MLNSLNFPLVEYIPNETGNQADDTRPCEESLSRSLSYIISPLTHTQCWCEVFLCVFCSRTQNPTERRVSHFVVSRVDAPQHLGMCASVIIHLPTHLSTKTIASDLVCICMLYLYCTNFTNKALLCQVIFIYVCRSYKCD